MSAKRKWLLGAVIVILIGAGYLWFRLPSKAERECLDETMNQPYVSRDYYAEYFEECLIKKGVRERGPVIIPPDTFIEESA